MRRDVFQAIADPVRRSIIGLLAKESLNLNALADHFDISRPAVSKHIRILAECGLLLITKRGRERYCTPEFKKIKQVADWAAQYEVFWQAKLDVLEQYLQQSPPAKKTLSKLKK